MIKLKALTAKAAKHHGSVTAVMEKAVNSHFNPDISSIPDDRWLATMTRHVFSAGFAWKVIEAKWPGFEDAFEGFDPHKLAFFGDEMLDNLVSDTRIVRNGQKIRATLENARFVAETSKEHDGFGRFIDSWEADDQLGLMTHLSKYGSRLGGATSQYFLRFSGYDAWIASRDVCAALHREGVLDKPEAKTKGALKKVQAAFNDLHEESGEPYAVISRVLALSVG